ncbi:ATP-binding protein [Colwellia psychrerythraea]|uniref:histidine kinase n=1 Tax=Colwellia psychrerythraea TaxID=28229 RepID=A0A099L398_COLPS|nr:ATP-binding protein [Colwellia psychrerythraea]KGJ97439.1 histidine kinase [Colwellia psychrerythraea]
MMTKSLVILFFLLKLIIYQTLAVAKSPTTLPISVSPLDVHSPFFQTLNHESAVFNYVNYEIAQDSEGFLWFAGYGGLVRFDGYEVKEFKHDPKNHYSIAEDAVRSISADNDAGLWLSLYNLGLSHYDAKTKTFTHYPHDKNNLNSPSSNTIRDIIVLENNDLWIGGKGGLSYYTSKTKTFNHFVSGSDIKNDNYILDMTIDRQGVLWLSTAKGLKVFDNITKKLIVPTLVNENNQPLKPAQQSKLFRKIITAENGKIWLAGFHENIHVLDPNTKMIFPLADREKGGKYNHMSINQVNDNEIWVSNLTTGIEVFNAKTMEKTKHISANNKKPHQLQRINVDVIYTDVSGNIWLSFYGEKPQFYNQNLSAYQYIKFDRNINGEGILRVKPLDKNISIISIFKHLALFDRKQGSLKPLNFPKSLAFKDTAWEISELTLGRDNELWLGLTTPTLIKFNLATQEEHYYSFDELGVRGNVTYGINYISDNEIIISTSGGAMTFNPKTEKFAALKTTQGDEIHSRVWRSYKSEQDDYFLASNEGLLYQLNDQQGFSLLPLDKSTFKGSSVEMIAKGKEGELWIFTNQAIYQAKITEAQIALTQVPQPDSQLPIDRVAITIDEQGLLWLGPYVYYDPYNRKYVNLSHYSYLTKNAFNDTISLANHIYVSSDKEILIIDKNKIEPQTYQAPIRLTELTSGKQQLNEQQLANSITIPAISQEFSARFSALDFAHANNTSYQYRLKGLDEFWRTTSSLERRASYNSLPPGNFVLEIKAYHESGAVEHRKLSIAITVQPKFYQTIWFKISIIFTIAVCLWLIHKVFLKRAMVKEHAVNTHKLAIERAEMMEDLIIKKNQLLADVSHELSTPLTVLKLQVESLKDDLEDDVQVTYQALDNKLDDIQHLIDDIHQLAQSDVGALQLNMKHFELNEALDHWQEELSQFINNNKLSFTFIRNLPKTLMVNFDKDRIKQVFINLLTNSIKYTNKPGQVQLHATVQEDTLVFIIEDSAPGVTGDDLSNIFERLYRVESSRSRETGGSGLGLAICKSLISGHNGQIYAKQSDIGGLKIVITLPLL